MPSTRILLLSIAEAVLYGEVHDQITAHLCVEYFTVAHPRVLSTDSPARLALYWGFAATWWVGVLLGVPLMVVCRAGRWPRLSAEQLCRPIGMLLAAMATSALLSGVAGYLLSARRVLPPGDWAPYIPEAKLPAFTADLFAHWTSYGAGFAGGLVVIGWAILRRRRLQRETVTPGEDV